MNRFNFFVAFAIALIASGPVLAYSSQGGYGGGAAVEAPSSGDYQLQNANSNDASASALAGAGSGAGDANSGGPLNAGPSSFGNSQSIPYSPANVRGNSVTSSITYPQNKGEILIHRPAPIIVKRPPTKVIVNHAPLVVKPAPVVLHKPPAVVVRKVYVKQHPRPVKVEPVYVNVVKPPAEKYFVKEQNQINGSPLGPLPAGYQPLAPGAAGQAALGNLGNLGPGLNAAGALSLGQLQNLQGLNGLSGNGLPVNGLPTSNGDYQLVNGQGLSALGNIASGGYGQSANQYSPSGY